MVTPRKPWTREETMLAYRLYLELPFGKLHRGNPSVIAMAQRLERSPSSIALKLVNFAHLDPALQARGIRGMGNVSALDREVVAAFADDWDAAATIAPLTSVDSDDDVIASLAGRPTEALAATKVRLTQRFFRRAVLAAYDATCCICGIKTAPLVVASHIVPWAADPKLRTNPSNGLSLCALHDRAFDSGLLTVTPVHVVRISNEVQDEVPVARSAFADSAGSTITLPTRFAPKPEFLQYHNDRVFRG